MSRALEEREAALRQQYDKILEEKLAEQFNAFSRFNQDNIHRQMTESTYNCMSTFPLYLLPVARSCSVPSALPFHVCAESFRRSARAVSSPLLRQLCLCSLLSITLRRLMHCSRSACALCHGFSAYRALPVQGPTSRSLVLKPNGAGNEHERLIFLVTSGR